MPGMPSIEMLQPVSNKMIAAAMPPLKRDTIITYVPAAAHM